MLQSHRGDKPVRYNHFMIRKDDWKLLHPSGFGRESLVGEPKFELYNLAVDPTESNNLVAENDQKFQELKTEYDKWFDDVSSTRPNNYDPPRIYIGSEHESKTVLSRQDWRGGSWHVDAEGAWLLDCRQTGKYNVEVLFPPSPQDEKVVLEIATQKRTKTVRAGSDQCTLRDIALNEGKLTLAAHCISPAKRRGVYQVIVTRSTSE